MILLSNGGHNSHRAAQPSDTILVGTVDGIALLKRGETGWAVAHKALAGCFVSAVTAADDGTLYAATHGVGVARSRDGGMTWQWVNRGLDRHDLWSARAGKLQAKDVVLVGALPAHLYLSEDAGETWRELTGLRAVAGAENWCFPPPPRVGHIKEIVLDGDRLMVGIEIGALLVSTDFGETFTDLRVDPLVGENDIHRILVHPDRPGRILIANGIVGVMTSDDNGKTWRKNPMPAEANYPDPFVIHPDNPDLLFLTAGVGWPPHWYALVTGFLESGEMPEEAVLREVEEEIGLSATLESYIGMYEFYRSNQLIIAYHVTVPSKDVRLCPSEIADHKWVHVEQVRPWSAGTGKALRDWLRSRGIERDLVDINDARN